jgi:FMN phosphatase YigB (HAD superfamily)
MSDPIIKVVYFDLGDTLVITDDRSWIPGAKDLLASLRAVPVRLGVISNTNGFKRSELSSFLPGDFDWRAFDNDLVILSSEVGVAKPDPEIFRIAIERTGLDAWACLFCTEDLLDTLVAQSVGMRVARASKPPSSDVGDLFAALKKSGLVPAAP